MRWTRRRGDPGRPRAPALPAGVAGGADHPGRRGGARSHRAGRRPARGHRRESPHAVRVRPDDPGGRRDLSRAGRDQLRRGHGVHEGGATSPRPTTCPSPRTARTTSPCIFWPPPPTAPISKRTASGWIATSPSLSGSRTDSPSRRIAPVTASSSTGRGWRLAGRRTPSPQDRKERSKCRMATASSPLRNFRYRATKFFPAFVKRIPLRGPPP